MSTFHEVRAVVFDAVGTVIEADPPVIPVYQAAGARHGSGLSTGDISTRLPLAIKERFRGEQSSEELERERWSRVVADTFHDVSDTSALFDELWQHFAEAHHWRVTDGVALLWQQLEAHGYAIAIASNFDSRLLHIAQHLPPLNRTSSIFVSSQLGYSKPHTSFFRAVEDSVCLAPHELLMIGDSRVNDYDGAREAGWHALHLSASVAAGDRTVPSLGSVRVHLDI